MIDMSKILVATPVKDEEKNLPRYFALLGKLKYPRNLLTYAFIENDSTDKTYQMLVNWKKRQPRPVWLKKNDLGTELSKFERLAILRNTLIEEALKDESYVFWADADILTLPARTVQVLLKDNVDIVSPLEVFREPPLRSFYYLGREERPYVKDVPKGLIRVGFVGGICLVKREVYDAGVRYEVRKDMGETTSFCLNAGKKDFACYVDTRVQVEIPNPLNSR